MSADVASQVLPVRSCQPKALPELDALRQADTSSAGFPCGQQGARRGGVVGRRTPRVFADSPLAGEDEPT